MLLFKLFKNNNINKFIFLSTTTTISKRSLAHQTRARNSTNNNHKYYNNQYNSSNKTSFAKKPSLAKAVLKPVIYFELAFLVGSYLVWKRMNSSQEFRFYMRNNYPNILEGYYLIGEKAGNLDTRQFDLDTWKNQEEK